MLERDPARLQEFRDYFTINVTEFFRDAERFRYLETKVLPGASGAAEGPLKVWSAACSIGAEPYSVAILLRELAPMLRHKILATDVDVTIIERARRADDFVTGRAEGTSRRPGSSERSCRPRTGPTRCARRSGRWWTCGCTTC